MAAGYREECQQADTLPLLMDHDSSTVPHSREHVLTITSGSPEGTDEREGMSQNLEPSSTSASHSETVISLGPPGVASTGQSQVNPGSTGFSSPRASESHGDETSFGSRQRTSPLNSGLWISIELTITLSQIIASIIVLSLSQDEKPKAPLSVWVLGYAAGCLATLPLLYWRYTHHYALQFEHTPHHAPSTFSPPSNWNLPQSSFSPTRATSPQGGESSSILSLARGRRLLAGGDPRMAIHIERFKIALDCFFAVWFVVGNVWIFGGHSSSREAPNLYRLCIVFLTFSCIGYAMPFIICATICCCLPCLITVLGFREDQEQTKGATPEAIEALPIYKFRRGDASGGKGSKDPNDSDSESFGEEGGVVAPGTDQERPVSAEDAVCCICLGKYKDDVELRGLPCAHFFHVDCVDKWLKINASCPLCKHEISGSSEDSEQQQANRAGE
eukprot:c22389_g1_i1 orf=271-1605(+)